MTERVNQYFTREMNPSWSGVLLRFRDLGLQELIDSFSERLNEPEKFFYPQDAAESLKVLKGSELVLNTVEDFLDQIPWGEYCKQQDRFDQMKMEISSRREAIQGGLTQFG